MTLVSRRHFVRKAAFAAAVCGHSATAFRHSFGIVRAAQSPDAPLDDGSIRKLASHIAGRIITAGAPDYNTARSVFNLAYDRRPVAIVRCARPSDVGRSVEFAQMHNLPLAVRAGGHSRLGFGVCDGGVVVDLSAMKQINVYTDKREVHAGAGALVVDLDTATQRFGLATTSGGCPTVGIAGFTLGGGEGRLMEKYGAACDNLLWAQVVTVDGREIEASPEVNPDLFWAIRGGGGNFGVVTALKYQLHPVDQVLSGALTYPAGRIPELLHALTSYLASAPDEMDAFAQLLPSEKGRKLKIDVCYCGPPSSGNDLLRPLRALNPQDDTVKIMSYLDAQAAGGFLSAPVAHFQTNLFVRDLGDRAIAAINTAISAAPVTCKVIIVPLRGAISRVKPTDTAFALREPGYELDIAGSWSKPAMKADVMQWVKAARDHLQPFAHGLYVNQLGDTSDELVRTAYGPNYPRLAAIKKKYDPQNVLRLNQNIKPEGDSVT